MTTNNKEYDDLLKAMIENSKNEASTNTDFTTMLPFTAFCNYANEKDIFPEFEFQGLMGNNDIYASIELSEDDEPLTLTERAENLGVSIDTLEAAIELDIKPDNISECYAGAFQSDSDFAQHTAAQTAALKADAVWPYTCIDWEYAGQELMHDYSESNGEYFRNQ